MGNVLSLEFSDATFDAAAIVEVIEHVPDKTIAFREVCRVLKPGGLLLLSTPNAECVPWLKDERMRSCARRLLGRSHVDKDEPLTIEELRYLAETSNLECIDGPRYYWYRPYRQFKGKVWWPPRLAWRGLLGTMRRCRQIEEHGSLGDSVRRYHYQSLLLAARKRQD